MAPTLARRRDPFGLPHDRDKRRKLRCHQHRGRHRPRRRPVRHQRPQVVDQRSDRSSPQASHRHGQDRSRGGTAPSAVDGPRPGRHPGVAFVRDVPVFGRNDQHGHCEVVHDDVRVSVTHLLGEEGAGFAMARDRLGPGRIHPCMHALGGGGAGTRPDDLPAKHRGDFGMPLAEQGSVQQQIGESRIAVDQVGCCAGRRRGPSTFTATGRRRRTCRRPRSRYPRHAGGHRPHHPGLRRAGVSDDVPLAAMYGWQRAMRVFDGPGEVHLRTIAKTGPRRNAG